MSDASPLLALPYIQPSQAQKHVTHNEALRRLDILVQLSVIGFDADVPPASPSNGDVYALGTGATGVWAGQDGRIAAYVDGGWLFFTPAEGWRATARGTGTLRLYSGGTWVLPNAGATLDNLDRVGVNTGADATNRLAVSSPATLLSHDGAGHQVKINKAGTGDTGALLFQSGWSGRAELGLLGNDGFSLKVSGDGTAWTTALATAPATGNVGIGVSSPQASLHIKDVLRLSPSSTPVNPGRGDIYFDDTTDTLRCFDGLIWHDLF